MDFSQIEMSKAERLLSYSLLSLISSKPLASASTVGINEDDGSYDVKEKGLLNDEGAWCWREGCESKTIHGLQMHPSYINFFFLSKAVSS